MQSTSVPLLLIAAGTVGFLHSILPDHWVPLAVIGRTQHWSVARVGRVSFLASVGHVLTSLIIAAIIAAVGLQFRHAFETQQGHIVGVILVLTGLGFRVWTLTGHGGITTASTTITVTVVMIITTSTVRTRSPAVHSCGASRLSRFRSVPPPRPTSPFSPSRSPRVL